MVTFGGGYPNTVFVERLDFYSETFSLPGNNLSQARSNLAATESNSYGYFAGGNYAIATVDRLDFSNETTSAPGSTMPYSTYGGGVAAFSSNSYGYFGGGTNGPVYTSRIRRLDFSNHTFSNPSSLLLSAIKDSMTATESNSYGYFAGGDGPPPGPSPISVNTVERLDFSSEAISLPGNNLPAAREDMAAVSN